MSGEHSKDDAMGKVYASECGEGLQAAVESPEGENRVVVETKRDSDQEDRQEEVLCRPPAEAEQVAVSLPGPLGARTMTAKPPPRIGTQQHRWLYGGPEPWKRVAYPFKPVAGRPPRVLRRLIEKGWMEAWRDERYRWGPRKGGWVHESMAGCRCRLTAKGLAVIQARKQWLRERAPAGAGCEGTSP